MDLIELLDKHELPRDGELDTESQLSSMFGGYLADARAISGSTFNLAAAMGLANEISAAVQHWLNGDPYSAIRCFDSAMATVQSDCSAYFEGGHCNGADVSSSRGCSE